MEEKKLPRKERRRLVRERKQKWGAGTLSHCENTEEAQKRIASEREAARAKKKNPASLLTMLGASFMYHPANHPGDEL